jgi:hypothetical protein
VRAKVEHMQADRLSGWALYAAVWHRPDPDRGFRAMCGVALPASVELTTARVAAAEIAANRTTVCGRCERRVEQARGPAAAPGSATLTPEQKKVKDCLDHERAQRAEARRRAELDKQGSG